MAEVFDPKNPGSGVGVGSPMLTGTFYPAIDARAPGGLGDVVPWGAGSIATQILSPVSGGGEGGGASQVDQLGLAIALLSAPRGDIINYNVEGLSGPMGPPGPPGPPGVGFLQGTVPPVGYDIPQRVIDDGMTPATPSGLTATALVLSVLLDWTDNTETDMNHYEIWRHTSDASGSASLIAKTKTTFFIDGNLAAGVIMYYWLKAVDNVGNKSAFTATVSATPLSVGAKMTADIPITNGIVFSDAGSSKVAWTGGTLSYKGTDYTITADATGVTSKWIYWDLDDTPTTFLDTDTLATAVGDASTWVMCYNDAGTPYPAFGQKIIHGGLIEASSIDTQHLAADAVEAGNINVVGLDGSGRIVVADATDANVVTGGINTHATTIILPGKVLVQSGQTDTIEDWASGTSIDGGKIATDTILAASISTYNLTAANATLANLMVESAHIDDLSVGNGKIIDDSVTTTESAYTAAEGDTMDDAGWTEVQTDDFSSAGEMVFVSGSCTAHNAHGSAVGFKLGLFRDGTQIGDGVAADIDASDTKDFTVFAADSPGSGGPYTYTLEGWPWLTTKISASKAHLNIQEGRGK